MKQAMMYWWQRNRMNEWFVHLFWKFSWCFPVETLTHEDAHASSHAQRSKSYAIEKALAPVLLLQRENAEKLTAIQQQIETLQHQMRLANRNRDLASSSSDLFRIVLIMVIQLILFWWFKWMMTSPPFRLRTLESVQMIWHSIFGQVINLYLVIYWVHGALKPTKLYAPSTRMLRPVWGTIA